MLFGVCVCVCVCVCDGVQQLTAGDKPDPTRHLELFNNVCVCVCVCVFAQLAVGLLIGW